MPIDNDNATAVYGNLREKDASACRIWGHAYKVTDTDLINPIDAEIASRNMRYIPFWP